VTTTGALWQVRFAQVMTAAAVVVPTLIVHWVAMGYAVFAQTVAVTLWGIAVAAWAVAEPCSSVPWRRHAPLLVALALLALGSTVSWIALATPLGPTVCTLGLLIAAGFVLVTAGRLAGGPQRDAAFTSLQWGCIVAGVCGVAVAAIQVFRPELTDGFWLARAVPSGRASANLNQPNHLGLILTWSVLACSALAAQRPRALGWLATTAIASAAAIAWTGSRAALAMMAFVALWGLADRRLNPIARRIILCAALAALAMTLVWQVWGHAIGAGPAPSSLGRTSARSGMLHDTWVLITQNPWVGVGWAEFNLAWTLSPFEPGGPRYFDHTHNLVLNLLVELGVPLGAAIVALLAWGLMRIWQVLVPAESESSHRLIAASMVTVAMLHGMVEFPLWFAYFLLPCAWLWGWALSPSVATDPAAPRTSERPTPQVPWLTLGGAVAFAGFLAWMDFVRAMPAGLAQSDPVSTARHIEMARNSVLFRHFADYRQALADAQAPIELFRSARHVVIDTPLLRAWADAMARDGHIDEARHLDLRLRKFDPTHPGSPRTCGAADTGEPAAHCAQPPVAVDWRRFR
jgi:O-antigen ligase